MIVSVGFPRFCATLLACILGVSCVTTSAPKPDPGASGFDAVAGNWIYSGSGSPNVSLDEYDGLPDIGKFLDRHMRGSTLSIAQDGSASFLSMGRTMSFKLRVAEENALAIKLEGEGDSAVEGKFYTYDRRKDRIIMPVEVDTPGNDGEMTARFKRTR